MLRSSLMALVLVATVAPGPAGAQTSRSDAEKNTLDARVGRWNVTETVWDHPGSPPVISTGLMAERRMVGDYLEETLLAADNPAAGPKRIDYLGFDRVAGRWDYVSLDVRAPVPLMPAWSFDRGDPSQIVVRFALFALAGSSPLAAGPMLRMQESIIQDGSDHETKDQFFILADGSGTEWLAHRYDYIRQR
jgi:hypothetical protein